MSSTRVGIYIEGLGMKFVIFCNFFRIFWTPNGQKRLVATASTRGPIRSRHVDQSDRATSLSPALSPPSTPNTSWSPCQPRARIGVLHSPQPSHWFAGQPSATDVMSRTRKRQTQCRGFAGPTLRTSIFLATHMRMNNVDMAYSVGGGSV